MNARLSAVFCVTARSGLGHLRRATNVAHALKQLRPDVDLFLLINAPVSCLSVRERALFAQIEQVDRKDMARRAARLPPGPIIVDTAVVPDVAFLLRPLMLILRETVSCKLNEFRLPGERRWDRVIVPCPSNEWTVAPDTIGARDVANVGWIFRKAEQTDCGRVLPKDDAARTILVASGGGGAFDRSCDLAAEMDGSIELLRSKLPQPVRVIQAVGPRASGTLRHAGEVLEVGSKLNQAFGEVAYCFRDITQLPTWV